MSIFAVLKSEDSDRLISWPLLTNLFSPDAPKVSLSEPSLFNLIDYSEAQLSSITADAEKMFHNITLPPIFSALFLLPRIRLS